MRAPSASEGIFSVCVCVGVCGCVCEDPETAGGWTERQAVCTLRVCKYKASILVPGPHPPAPRSQGAVQGAVQGPWEVGRAGCGARVEVAVVAVYVRQ